MAKGKGFGGFGGGMNMQAMMKQAQKMQESMLKAQEEIAQMESTGTAGGGMVTADCNPGTSTLKSIEIKPDVVDRTTSTCCRIWSLQRSMRHSRRLPTSRRARCPAITGGIGGGLGGLL